MTTHEAELGVSNDSLRRDAANLAEGLRAILGPTLVAYIGGVRDTRALREWVEGARKKSAVVVERLRLAYCAAKILEAERVRLSCRPGFKD